MLCSKNNKNSAKNTVKGNQNINIQNSNININKDMDEVLELAREGDHIGALKKMGVFRRCFSVMHPLYPYFKYSLNMNEKEVAIKVITANEEAIRKYPPHGDIKFLIPDEYKWAKNINELLQYGYEKQIPIKLKADSIKLWLGDYLMEEFESGSKVRIEAKKFPGPIPMKFEFTDTSFRLDYLKMGLIKIENDYLIISNLKQKETKLVLTLFINKSDISSSKLNIAVAEKYIDNLEVNLKMKKFLFNLNREGIKKLVLLENDNEFMSFSDSNINYPSIRTLEKEIELFERLNVVEKYYNVFFKSPQKINEDDYENLFILEKSMINEPITGTYSEIPVLITVDISSNNDQIKSIIN